MFIRLLDSLGTNIPRKTITITMMMAMMTVMIMRSSRLIKSVKVNIHAFSTTEVRGLLHRVPVLLP